MKFRSPSLLPILLTALLGLSACVSPPVTEKLPTPPVVTPPVVQPPKAAEPLQPVSFSALPGWGVDDLREAWPAFVTSCSVLGKKPEWLEACTAASLVTANDSASIRSFFENFFQPYKVVNPDGAETGLVTGYYEPLLRGARNRGGPYQTALYSVPDDLLTIDISSLYPDLKNLRLRGRVVGRKVVPYFSRAELEQSGVLAGKELVWVDDAIEAFFLQVQGSGRVQLADSGETVRLAYAEQNGHPYRSIGRYLVDKGEMTLDQASAQTIRTWYLANPMRREELLNANPSYVFFKEEKIVNPSIGPKGALGVPLTPLRSIAVDPQYIPLGAPVYLSTTYPSKDIPLQRLMMAQDTGGAIRNPVRADFFWGFGAEAGDRAGKMKQRGSLWVLLPKPLLIAPAKP